MAKKTLSEKRASDLRYLYHFESVIKPQIKSQANVHSLQRNDLVSTMLITGLILASQLILYFALRGNLVRIPGMNY